MGLSILDTPDVFSSFNDDLVYTIIDAVAVSDPTTYPNFKYIADVYVGSTMVARIKKTPDPATGIGIFNVAQIVRNYAATVFNPGSGLVCQKFGDGSSNIQITLKLGEQYGGSDYINLLVSGTQYAFNTYNSRQTTGSGAFFVLDNYASNQPKSASVLFSSGFYLIPFQPHLLTSYPVVITPIRSDGTTAAPYSTTINIDNPYDLQQLNIAPQAINAVAGGILTSSMRGYTVKVGSQALITMSFICEPMYTPYMVHFLNRFGGFDSKLFTKVSRSSFDIVKSDFGKLPYQVDGSGIVSFKNANNVHYETRSVYSSQFTENIILNSDNLSDPEYTWLKELLLSPLVYVEEAGDFYPVTITDTNYEPKKNVNDDLTNLTVNIKYGQNLNAQYR